MNVRLQIVNKKRKKTYKVFQWLFLLSIIVLFWYVIFVSHQNKIILITILAITFFSGGWVNFAKETTSIGHIILSNNLITINTSHGQKKYKIVELDKIKIIFRECKDQNYPNFSSISLTKGLYNYIKIQRKNNFESFEVRLSKMDLKKINQIVKEWRKNSVEIVLINPFGKTVKNLTC